MNKRSSFTLLAGMLLLAPAVAVGQSRPEKVPAFHFSDYPKSEFQVTQTTHILGEISVHIIQAKRRRGSATVPSYCRAWVEVARNEKLIRRIYYDDFEPVGYKYGIFVPAKQPSSDYFVLVKEGDYDGRLLLVDKSGHVTNTFGGSYFVANGKFLISQYSSDEAGLAVFDLEAHKLILRTGDVPYIERWYKNGGGYFFTESEWSGSGEAHEKAGIAYRLNLQQGKISAVNMDLTVLHAAFPVKYDFDPRQYADCESR